MIKLYFGNVSAIIATILSLINIIYVSFMFINRSHVEKWGKHIIILVLLNGALWYFANIRDLYSNSILNAIDKSADVGLFSVTSIQSIVFWVIECLIWIVAIVSIFKTKQRESIFFIMAVSVFLQLGFIEFSRIWLYLTLPSSFNYMKF